MSNVRFIAATNRDVEKEAEAGTFRNDLYYRLSVFTISLPALRDRKDDITLLTKYFTKQFSLKTNKQEPSITKSFFKALEHHPWKGNIRELKNVIERSVILCDGELSEAILPSDFVKDENSNAFELSSVEKNHIKKVLVHTGGNKTQTAKLLGIGLTTLYQKIKDYNL